MNNKNKVCIVKLARVVGNVVSTVKIKSHENYKIMAVKPIDHHGNIVGKTFLALDVAQSGPGDCVLVLQEGKSIKEIMKDGKGDVEALIVGVIDYIKANGEQRDLTVDRN